MSPEPFAKPSDQYHRAAWFPQAIMGLQMSSHTHSHNSQNARRQSGGTFAVAGRYSQYVALLFLELAGQHPSHQSSLLYLNLMIRRSAERRVSIRVQEALDLPVFLVCIVRGRSRYHYLSQTPSLPCPVRQKQHSGQYEFSHRQNQLQNFAPSAREL